MGKTQLESCVKTPTDVLVLGIEAATPPASVALVRNEQVLASSCGPFGRDTDAWILDAIDKLLRQCELELAQLDAIAVSIGPGTFTGIRVGMATAAGLALGAGIPLAGVGTLDALIDGALEATGRAAATPVAACLDARRGEIYAAAAREIAYPTLPLALQWGPELMPPAQLASRLGQLDRPYAIGTGLALADGLAGLVRTVDDPPVVAVSVARLGARTLIHGGVSALPPAKPFYLRPPDASPGRNPLRNPLRK